MEFHAMDARLIIYFNKSDINQIVDRNQHAYLKSTARWKLKKIRFVFDSVGLLFENITTEASKKLEEASLVVFDTKWKVTI